MLVLGCIALISSCDERPQGVPVLPQVDRNESIDDSPRIDDPATRESNEGSPGGWIVHPTPTWEQQFTDCELGDDDSPECDDYWDWEG